MRQDGENTHPHHVCADHQLTFIPLPIGILPVFSPGLPYVLFVALVVGALLALNTVMVWASFSFMLLVYATSLALLCAEVGETDIAVSYHGFVGFE